MMQLVNPQDTYRKIYHEQACVGAGGECKCPVFILKKLSGKDGNDITDAMTDVSTGEFRYKPGVARQLKVEKAVVGWENIVDAQGVTVPCTNENKALLPFQLVLWIEDLVNKDNGFNITEEQRKNS